MPKPVVPVLTQIPDHDPEDPLTVFAVHIDGKKVGELYGDEKPWRTLPWWHSLGGPFDRFYTRSGALLDLTSRIAR